MATQPLPAPDFASIGLDMIDPPRLLLRMSAHMDNEPWFSFAGGGRFDAPESPALYGTCYLGLSLEVAFAEKVLHDAAPQQGRFAVAATTLEASWVHRYDGLGLKLADLTGAALKRLGGHAELSGTGDYALSQAWGAAVKTHPAGVDGFVFMSRHHTSGAAVVLFDRARLKLLPLGRQRLLDEPGFMDLMETFHVTPG